MDMVRDTQIFMEGGGKMKNFQYKIIPCVLIGLILIKATQKGPTTFKDIYTEGRVRLTPEIIIDNNSMPEEVSFNLPYDISLDGKGNIYISDYKANNIKVFDSTGKFNKIIGRKGQGYSEFYSPANITFAKDRLVIWNPIGRRLFSLTPEGKLINSINITMHDGRVRKLRSLPNGDIVIELEKIFYNNWERPQECTIAIYSPILENKKNSYSHDVWTYKFMRGIYGGLANVLKPFSPRVYWDVSPQGKIIIGFSEKYEIEIHDPVSGKISSFNHFHKTQKVTEQDIRSYLKRWISLSNTSKEDITFFKENTKFPKYKPVFNNLLTDGEGNILVYTYMNGQNKLYRHFDAFTPEGNFIGNIQVVGDIPFPLSPRVCFFKQNLWVLTEEKGKLSKLIKCNISK